MMARTPNPLETSMMMAAMAEDTVRRDSMLRAWAAYQGTTVLGTPTQLDRALITEPGDVDDNVPVNIIRPMVNAGVDFLFGQPPTMELPTKVDHEDTDEDSPEEEWLKECLRLNNWDALLLDAGINAAIFDTAYIAIDTTKPYPNKDQPAKSYPRLCVKDSSCMSMWWNPRDITQIEAYVHESARSAIRQFVSMPVWERQVTRRQPDGTWLITDEWTSMRGTSSYMPDPTSTPVHWPFQWPPIIHWKNLPAPNQPYGEPDVTEGLIQLNKALSYNMSDSQRTVRKFARPKVVTKGVSDMLEVADIVWQVDEDSDVQLLSPSADNVLIKQTRDDIYEFALEETGTPSIIMGRPDQDGIPPSGVALQMKMNPIVRKTKTKRKLAGPAIVELMRRLYELAKYGDDYIVSLTWPELVPNDPHAERQSLMQDRQLGVKREVIALKLGYKLADLDEEQPMPPGLLPGMQGDSAGTTQEQSGMQGGQVPQNSSQANTGQKAMNTPQAGRTSK